MKYIKSIYSQAYKGESESGFLISLNNLLGDAIQIDDMKLIELAEGLISLRLKELRGWATQ